MGTDRYDAVYDTAFDTIVCDTTSRSADELARRIGERVAPLAGVEVGVAAEVALCRLVERVASPEEVSAAIAADLVTPTHP